MKLIFFFIVAVSSNSSRCVCSMSILATLHFCLMLESVQLCLNWQSATAICVFHIASKKAELLFLGWPLMRCTAPFDSKFLGDLLRGNHHGHVSDCFNGFNDALAATIAATPPGHTAVESVVFLLPQVRSVPAWFSRRGTSTLHCSEAKSSLFWLYLLEWQSGCRRNVL